MKILLFAADHSTRWHGSVPKHRVDIAGEPLLKRTLRQLAEQGHQPAVISERYSCISEAVLSTAELWGDRTVILLGDVVWPNEVLARVLADTRSPGVYGNYCEIYAVAFGQQNKDAVLEALGRAAGNPPGKLWQFYRALFSDDLALHQWDDQGIFQTIPSAGTPAYNARDAFTQDFDRLSEYYMFLEQCAWARTADNWPHAGRKHLSCVATGTGRCGTGFVAQLLTSAGLLCGHEGIFSFPGGLHEARMRMWDRPNLQADSSWLAAPYLDSDLLENTTIVHLIRHPQRTTSSAYGLGAFQGDGLTGYNNFNLHHLPSIERFSKPLDKIGHRYVRWNRMIEEKAQHRDYLKHFIDRQEPLELLERLETRGLICLDGIDPGALYDNRKYNSRGKRDLVRLADFSPAVARDLAEISEEYGYAWADD